jgi:CheY-like chemotaxis protein
VAAVEGRIKALARAHALLSESRWHGADIGALVEEELAPYRAAEGERIVIGGPNVSLLPHMAQGLALALHELATNAAKHGALSSVAGKVSVTWQRQPELLVLQWIERDGPGIVPPSARSFGLKVIRASIEQQLGGKAIFEWHPIGLQCTLSFPQGEAAKRGEAPNARGSTNGGSVAASMAESRRVLLVEDEVLVAMMIQEFLSECGRAVIGPISTAAEALATARQGDFDGAILDINLGDGMAYPVAEILAARGVPFVFLTGYEADTVDDRFSEVPILQKPIERQMLQRIFLPSVIGAGVVHRDGARTAAVPARP